MSESGYGLRGMRVLVTGSTGFIGSKLVRRLLDHEAKVTVVVDSEPEVARLEPLLADSRLHLVPCSVADADDIAAQRERWGDIDLLVHLRLQVPQTKTFCEQASEDITMNLLPTLNLLRALDGSVRGICFASSVAVYGCPSRLPVREDDLPQPISSYGVTKLAIENYLRAYGRARQVPVGDRLRSRAPGAVNEHAASDTIFASGVPSSWPGTPSSRDRVLWWSGPAVTGPTPPRPQRSLGR